MRLALGILVALTLGCSEGGRSPAAQFHGLIVHEWGTYTSVMASDGRVMEGLHHTDEKLPPFVHARIGVALAPAKGIETLPEPVNQKLETPVIYFYGDVARASVDVRFPGGVISEWYPSSMGMLPAYGSLTRIANGQMSWDVSLRDLEDVSPPSVTADSVWAPSRKVASLGVRTDLKQDEGFIFYRGLGRFEVPFKVETITGGNLRISNLSEEAIPAVFMLHVHEGGGAVAALGPLAPGASIVTSPTPKERNLDEYMRLASELLQVSLQDSGLYPDEARAMVETWQRSYFQTFGKRVLYLAPRAWTDRLLPMTLSPAPDQLVRTLVGRVEVLTASEEADIVARIQNAYLGGQSLPPGSFGRFAEPKLRRAYELLPKDDPALDSYAKSLVTAATAMP